MAVQNEMQIYRSNVTATPSTLLDGQLGWSGVSNTLFIGDFGTVEPIGGRGLLTRGYEVIAGNITAQTTITVGTFSINGVIDDDSFASASNTTLSTSESIKSYVDSVAGAGVSSINDITDVNITTVANNDLLVYDATAGDWENHTISGTSGIGVTFSGQDITVALQNTAVSGGSYGDANTVGTFTVGADGRLTAAGLADINHDTLLNFVANEHVDHSGVSITAGNGLTGGGNITASRTLTVGAGNGITTNATSVAVQAGTDIVSNSTGVHVGANVVRTADLPANTSLSSAAWTDANNTLTFTRADASTTAVTLSFAEYLESSDINDVIGGTGVTVNQPDLTSANVVISIGQDVATTADVTFNDMNVTGNLTVTGTTTVVDTQNLTVEDPLIKLAKDNTAGDTVDIGFFGVYNDGAGAEYSGIFRDSSDGSYKLFDSLTVEPTSTVDTANASFNLANFEVGALTAASLSLTTNLGVSDGGTGVGTFVTNGILYGNGTGAIQDTAAGTQYQVLQAGSGGVPEWGSLDGGTF